MTKLVMKLTMEEFQASAVIDDEEYYTFPNSQLTICCLTLKNGYSVTGESTCVIPKVTKDISKQIARTNAINKIWPLEGYLLKQQIHERKGKQ